MLPDDYRYEWVRDALGAIHDAGIESLDDADDLEHEFADGVDAYTTDLYKWLSSNLTRAAYVDEARAEGLISEDTDLVRQIAIGQYMERCEVFASVVESLREYVEAD